MERLNIRVVARGKVQPLHAIAATVSPKRALPPQVKKTTCGVVKSDGKESGRAASAIPLDVDAVAICSSVVELVDKRKVSNDYLNASLGEEKKKRDCRRCTFRLRLCLRG